MFNLGERERERERERVGLNEFNRQWTNHRYTRYRNKQQLSRVCTNLPEMYILIRVLEQKQKGTESKLEIDRVCVWVGEGGVREMFLSKSDEDTSAVW